MFKPQSFTVGLNKKVVGKCNPQTLSYAGAWQDTRLDSIEQLADHISKGHPWMPAILDGDRKRKQANSNHAELLGLDIDSGLTIEQALDHPFIQRHCSLLIESSSSTPEHHKFRLVFRLAEPIEGWENIRLVNRWLAEQVGSADPACKDASRYFFGGLGREPRLLQPEATLPTDLLNQAQSWEDAIAAAAAAEIERRRQQWAALPRDESGDLVKDALAHIAPYTPGEGRYNDLITMMGGVLNELGSEGERLLLDWDAGRGNWGEPLERKLAGLARTPGRAGIGSLFHLAKLEGFVFPKRQREKLRKLSGGKGSPKQAAAVAARAAAADKAAIDVASALGLPASSGSAAIAALKNFYRPGQVPATRTIDNSGQNLSPDDASWLANGDSIKLLDGNTGDGKTYAAGQVLPQLGNVLDIASTCNLAGGLGDRHGLTPVSSRHGEGDMDRAAIPAESLHRSIGTDYDASFIDEIDVVLRRIIEGSLGRDRQDSNLRQLKRLLKKSGIAIAAQAQPSPVTVELLKYLSGRDVDVAKVERPKAAAGLVTAYEYPDRESLLTEAIEAQRQGQRILMIWGGVDSHRSILRELRKATPKGSKPVVGRDGRYTLPKAITHFGIDPNGDLSRYGSASITRVAETGADIQEHYDRVFFIPSPAQDSEQCWQHISRARGLLNGAINRLDYALPDQSYTSVEHLNPAYHAEQRKRRNAYYLGLLESSQGSQGQALASIKAKLAELDTLFGFLARYEAESAARLFFRDEYLRERFKRLGWHHRLVDAGGCDRKAIKQVLKDGKRRITLAAAFTIAKGHRDIADFSQWRIDQIEDDRQQGFVLSGYRRKLSLARTLPDSPLEDARWLAEWVVGNELAEPQARFRALLLLAQDDGMRSHFDQLQHLRQGSAIELGRARGPLALLAKLSKSKDLPLLAVVGDFYDDPLLRQILSDRNTGWYKLQPQALALANKIGANVERLNSLSFEVLDKHLDWTETDPCSLINKFLKQCLGLQHDGGRQKRMGNDRPRVYRLEGSEESLGRIKDDAKRQATLEHWQQLDNLTNSAKKGWVNTLQAAGFWGVTLNPQSDPPIQQFSVTPPQPIAAKPSQAPPPPPPPPPAPTRWRYIGQKYAAHYGGVLLTLNQKQHGYANYITEDGRITTWIYPEDVVAA